MLRACLEKSVQPNGWRLALYLDGPDPFAAAASRQVALYLWMGILVVVIIALSAISIGYYINRQMRLTRLKNNLIATVSHELKTPLASMRVLVDTLIEGRCRDEKQEREYLELMARENVRLSRLIDNFLTFSRMERAKIAFEFTDVRPAAIVNEAAEAVQERFEAGECKFDLEITPDLPPITVDRDALITVLLNLLDNAFKYTKDNKHIILRAFSSDNAVHFEVEDNGIGLSSRAQRKIFNKFYQVDRTLARHAEGCGLGLSIAKFIIDAHGGKIEVKSQPDKGSTFSVKFPFDQRLVDADAK